MKVFVAMIDWVLSATGLIFSPEICLDWEDLKSWDASENTGEANASDLSRGIA